MKRLIFRLFIVLTAVAISGCNDQSESAPSQQSAVSAAQSAANASDEAIIAANDAAELGWRYSAEAAKMVTGGVDHFATIHSTNVVNFGFPYSGAQSATLVIRKMAEPSTSWKNDPGYEVMIYLDRGQLLGGDQGSIEAKLDAAASEVFGADAPDDGSTTALFFHDAESMTMQGYKGGHYKFTEAFPLQQFLKRMQSAKALKVQVTVYQNGNPTFVFNVAGFSLEKLDATKPASSQSTP